MPKEVQKEIWNAHLKTTKIDTWGCIGFDGGFEVRVASSFEQNLKSSNFLNIKANNELVAA